MPRPPRGDARKKLLDAVIDHVAERGLTDLSLRELASAIGTSHRMLLHHFGSREGLWVAVVQAVEARTLEHMLTLAAPEDATPGDVLRAFWRHLADPAIWPNERLFFELYGQALQGRPGAVELLDGIVDSWVEPAAASAEAQGLPPAEARAQARLGLAVTRGLLLDLLATGDRAGCDAAFEAYVALYERRLADLA